MFNIFLLIEKKTFPYLLRYSISISIANKSMKNVNRDITWGHFELEKRLNIIPIISIFK